jgi:hypothetical protein
MTWRRMQVQGSITLRELRGVIQALGLGGVTIGEFFGLSFL